MKHVAVDVDDLHAQESGPAWPLRLALTAWLFVLLFWLGVISLSWNLIALVLRLFLRPERALRVGRAGIAYGYRF